LWDNETGYELLNFKVSMAFNERWLNSIVFAKNGYWAISGGCNLRYWDLKTGTLFRNSGRRMWRRKSLRFKRRQAAFGKRRQIDKTSGSRFGTIAQNL
jgi:hypothetical protein